MTPPTPDESAKSSKKPLAPSVSQPLAQFEAVVHDMEEQVREAQLDQRAGESRADLATREGGRRVPL